MKYRKMPVVIEAEEFRGHEHPMPFAGRGDPVICVGPEFVWCIETLEGRHRVSIGDMVIRGVKGEFYACKPDIFALTYEVAE